MRIGSDWPSQYPLVEPGIPPIPIFLLMLSTYLRVTKSLVGERIDGVFAGGLECGIQGSQQGP